MCSYANLIEFFGKKKKDSSATKFEDLLKYTSFVHFVSQNQEVIFSDIMGNELVLTSDNEKYTWLPLKKFEIIPEVAISIFDSNPEKAKNRIRNAMKSLFSNTKSLRIAVRRHLSVEIVTAHCCYVESVFSAIRTP